MNDKENHVLFKTPHGSHLYGLAHADSDKDFYTVLDKVPTARARSRSSTTPRATSSRRTPLSMRLLTFVQRSECPQEHQKGT